MSKTLIELLDYIIYSIDSDDVDEEDENYTELFSTDDIKALKRVKVIFRANKITTTQELKDKLFNSVTKEDVQKEKCELHEEQTDVRTVHTGKQIKEIITSLEKRRSYLINKYRELLDSTDNDKRIEALNDLREIKNQLNHYSNGKFVQVENTQK